MTYLRLSLLEPGRPLPVPCCSSGLRSGWARGPARLASHVRFSPRTLRFVVFPDSEFCRGRARGCLSWDVWGDGWPGLQAPFEFSQLILYFLPLASPLRSSSPLPCSLLV